MNREERLKVKRYLLKKQSEKCFICEEKKSSLEIHHIKPKSYGGNDDINNLILLCSSCHKLVHNEIEAFIRNGLHYSFFRAIILRVKEEKSLEVFKKDKQKRNVLIKV